MNLNGLGKFTFLGMSLNSVRVTLNRNEIVKDWIWV